MLEEIADQMHNLVTGKTITKDIVGFSWSDANSRMELQVMKSAFDDEFADKGHHITKRLQSSGNFYRLSVLTPSGAEVFALEAITGPLYRLIDGEMVEVKK